MVQTGLVFQKTLGMVLGQDVVRRNSPAETGCKRRQQGGLPEEGAGAQVRGEGGGSQSSLIKGPVNSAGNRQGQGSLLAVQC